MSFSDCLDRHCPLFDQRIPQIRTAVCIKLMRPSELGSSVCRVWGSSP